MLALSLLQAGIIIAGGMSRRMGTDKALLPLSAPGVEVPQGEPANREDSDRNLGPETTPGIHRLLSEPTEPMLARILRQLRPVCQRIIIAAGDEARATIYREAIGRANQADAFPESDGYGGAGQGSGTTRFVLDHWPGAGPLSGLHSALHSAQIEAQAQESEPPAAYALVMACDMPCVNMALVRRMLAKAQATDADIVCAPGQPFHGLYHPRVAPVIESMLQGGEQRLMQLLAAVHTEYVAPSIEEEAVFEPLNTPEAYSRYRAEDTTGHPTSHSKPKN